MTAKTEHGYHEFEGIAAGTPDRPCTLCGLADRHRIHDPNVLALKRNAIAVADEHRMRCNDDGCVISLVLLCQLLIRAGFRITDEEWRHFH